MTAKHELHRICCRVQIQKLSVLRAVASCAQEHLGASWSAHLCVECAIVHALAPCVTRAPEWRGSSAARGCDGGDTRDARERGGGSKWPPAHACASITCNIIQHVAGCEISARVRRTPWVDDSDRCDETVVSAGALLPADEHAHAAGIHPPQRALLLLLVLPRRGRRRQGGSIILATSLVVPRRRIHVGRRPTRCLQSPAFTCASARPPSFVWGPAPTSRVTPPVPGDRDRDTFGTAEPGPEFASVQRQSSKDQRPKCSKTRPG